MEVTTSQAQSGTAEGSVAMFRAQSRRGYALIAATVALLYCAIVGPYLTFTNTVLPGGDPFTYTMGYFLLLDTAQRDYWAGLHLAFNANWYWMFNVPIALLSPILVKEPFSLSVVNFIVFGLATAAFFRLSRQLRLSPSLAILVTLTIWIFPINFGFQDYSSIAVLGLDSMFIGLLNLAAAALLVFVLDPFRWRSAVLAGVSVGVAIWGRGNSVLVVGMVGFVPVLWLAHRLWKTRTVPWVGLTLFTLIGGGMAAGFYGWMGGPISDYYANHLQFVTRHRWNLHDALPYIKNVPGFFFWRAEDSVTTVTLTWVLHALVAASPWLVWRRAAGEYRAALRLICATGVFIYFVTYLSMIALFTDPLITLYNCLLIYAPMRIGMTLVVLAAAGTLSSRGRLTLRRDIMLPTLAALVVYGVWLTRVQTPAQSPGTPTPVTVETFANTLTDMSQGEPISVLWYRSYNPTILGYYMRKKGTELRIHMDQYYNDLWQAHTYDDAKRIKVREELRSHFLNAALIIIPQYVDHYGMGEPYSFYRMREEIPNFLNSPESPRFVVRALVQDQANVHLLVLQREAEAKGAGEPLKLPYGPATEPHTDYGSRVVRIAP